jgi:hypothetical protein
MPRYSECCLLDGGLYHDQAQPQGTTLLKEAQAMTQDNTMPVRHVSG